MSTDEADTTAGATPDPNDPEALREEIERTRERLGETVEALAAKADVKAQAQQKVSELTGRVKAGAGQAKDKAAALAAPATSQVRQGTAAAAGGIAKVTPEPVKRAAGSAADTAKKNRGPLAAVAGAIGAAIVALLIILRLRKRS